MNKWLKIVQQGFAHCLRFPSHCLLCLTPTPQNIVCLTCEASLPWLRNAATQALFAYESPMEGFIVRLKFRHELHFATWFAQMMIKTWGRPEVDCIVGLPLHPKRQRERGFNQTMEIAKVLSKHWKIPLDRWSCTRVKHNRPQSELSASVRKTNVTSSSFHIAPGLKGKRVLVIEDVITTGTTLLAFETALKNAGVSTVICWACCHTMKN